MLQIRWTDEEIRKRYIAGISGMIEKHGGRFIVASSMFTVAEGSWKPGLLVVVEFPDMRALRDWYDSEEYRPLRALRLTGSESNAVLVEGV